MTRFSTIIADRVAHFIFFLNQGFFSFGTQGQLALKPKFLRANFKNWGPDSKNVETVEKTLFLMHFLKLQRFRCQFLDKFQVNLRKMLFSWFFSI